METEEKEEISKVLETLIIKIDELTDIMKDRKLVVEDNVKKTPKEYIDIVEKLTNKIDELTKAAKDKKTIAEDKIRKNPLAYMMGAFVGGLSLGILIKKRE